MLHGNAACKTTFHFSRAQASLRTIPALLYALIVSQNGNRYMIRANKAVNDVSDFVGDCVSIFTASIHTASDFNNILFIIDMKK